MAALSKTAFLKREADAMLKSAETQRGKQYAENFKAFTKTWAAYFDEQADDYIEFLDQNPQLTIGLAKSADDEAFRKEVEKGLLDTYVLGMTLQESDIREQLTVGLSFDIVDEDALEWADTRTGELIKGVNATTQKEIQAIISDALQNGMTMKDLKDEIYRKFSEYSEYRANLIAVMEMGNAFEQGKKAQFARYTQHFGVTGFKRSFYQDSTARETHKQNAEAGWIRATQLFPGTLTDTAPHGFNCRCNVQYSLYDPDEAKPIFM